MPPPKCGNYLNISVKTNPVYNLEQAAEDSHKPYGVDGPVPVQRTADVHQPFGTDKSVPYANSGVLQFIPLPQKDVTKAECMNAFPTKYSDKFQFSCLLRQADKEFYFLLDQSVFLCQNSPIKNRKGFVQ